MPVPNSMKKDIKILLTVAIVLIGLLLENYTLDLMNRPSNEAVLIGAFLSFMVGVLTIRGFLWIWEKKADKQEAKTDN